MGFGGNQAGPSGSLKARIIRHDEPQEPPKKDESESEDSE